MLIDLFNTVEYQYYYFSHLHFVTLTRRAQNIICIACEVDKMHEVLPTYEFEQKPIDYSSLALL